MALHEHGRPTRPGPADTSTTTPPEARLLDFRVLGPLEVADEGIPLPLGGLKQRALLGLLLVHANEVVATDRILDELWGEQPPRTAAASLQNLVSQLRKLLGPEVLLTRPPGYRLVVAADRLDAARFEELVRQAHAADEPAERVRRLELGLALWRGDALADLAYERLAESEAARLTELRLAAVEDLVDARLELGRHTDVVGELEALVAANPTRERLRGQLMLALYRSGRQAEALRVYHDARRALADELGLDPSPALQALYGSILRQEAALAPAARIPARGDHVDEVVHALLAGRLVLALGPGAGPAAVGVELVGRLARAFAYPPDEPLELPRVSQYVAVAHGVGPLYDELHDLLAGDLDPGPAATVAAALSRALRERGAPAPLLVTATYDHAVERAFRNAGEEIDVVSYIAAGRDRGRFLHVAADGSATVIELPNVYAGLAPERRTVVLKIHGQVDPSPDRTRESFVVSEDDYIDYLASTDLAGVMPVTVAARLRRSHFLFVGYSLAGWSFRVFLHRVWGDESVRYRSWSVQPGSDALEREFWRQRGIEVVDTPLDEYLRGLLARLEQAPARAGRAHANA